MSAIPLLDVFLYLTFFKVAVRIFKETDAVGVIISQIGAFVPLVVEHFQIKWKLQVILETVLSKLFYSQQNRGNHPIL